MLESILSVLGITYLSSVILSTVISLLAVTYLSHKCGKLLLGFLNRILVQD